MAIVARVVRPVQWFGQSFSKLGQRAVAIVAICNFVRFARPLLCRSLFTCSMPSKRKNYTAKVKLTAVKYVEEHGNRAAGHHFDVTETMIHSWRDKEADHGKKAQWPDLEGLHTWVLEQRAQGRAMSTVQLCLKAQTLAKEMGAVGFVGRLSWCSMFMRRKALVMRAHTNMCQNLSADLKEKLDRCQAFTNKASDNDSIGIAMNRSLLF
ncbi:hypothetical protein HPB52_005396 [Rhipicephalus sanguineus]|uniref:HTH CENPB-type domain-containing protein n=1 Tax=Rhipicephalus sanguineus TaxID=34632 RepID=A0A9D4SY98_RHISA|nr:hypothetical protein HPB52_005396 [Rhipicephalus sanguineus]